MYLATSTRPDIAHAVSYLSQFNSCYDVTHWTAAKRVLRYLKGTIDVGLTYRKSSRPLEGYVDADWAGCPLDRRSYTGHTFLLSGCPISWESRKQRTTALSSTESEYMALAEAAKQATYLLRFLEEIRNPVKLPIKVMCDSNGACKLAENPVFHNRTKHIDIKYHYIRETVQKGILKIERIPTLEMGADFLTKPVSAPKLQRCLQLIGILPQKDGAD